MAKRPARTSGFSAALAEKICARVAVGEGLSNICREDGMPDLETVIGRLEGDAAFARRLQTAREAQAEALFDEIARIAEREAPGEAARDKLRIDTLKWRLAKLSRRYDERAGGGGSEDDAPKIERIERVLVRPVEDTDP